jgi:hypothetical protein
MDQSYIDRNKELAQLGVFSGKALLEWHKQACWNTMVEHYAPTHWLDYGCGPASSYNENNPEGHSTLDIVLRTKSSFTLYDPCHPPYDTFPTLTTTPGVICVDVLEHIPEQDIPAVLNYLFSVCTTWMFLFASNKRNATKFVDSHESTHCTLKTRQEWVDMIKPYAEKYPHIALVLATDDAFDTFDHNGKGFTYNHWNMPVELVEKIKQKRLNQINLKPDVVNIYPWDLDKSNFN